MGDRLAQWKQKEGRNKLKSLANEKFGQLTLGCSYDYGQGCFLED